MSERRPFPHLHPKTAEFLVAAYHDGAYDRFLQQAQNSPDLARRLSTISLYLHLPNTTLEDTGKLLSPQQPLSRERARQYVQEGLAVLLRFSSDELQNRFSSEKIPLRKPLGNKSKIRQSLALGGKTVRIINMTAGGTPLNQVKKDLGLSGQNLIQARRVAQGWGLEIDYFQLPLSHLEQLAPLFSDPNSSEEKMLKTASTLTLNRARRLSTLGALLPLKTVAAQQGSFVIGEDLTEVRKALEEQGVRILSFKNSKNDPTSRSSYYIPRRYLDNI